LGLIVIAWIIEVSNALLFSTDSVWVKAVYYVGLTFIIGSILWLVFYVSPKLLELLLGVVHVQAKPAQTQQNQPPENRVPAATEDFSVKNLPASIKVKWVPVSQEAPAAYEESESERLRREFRGQGL
jgi:hypothetical protein